MSSFHQIPSALPQVSTEDSAGVRSTLEGGGWASPGTLSPPFHLPLLCPRPAPKEEALEGRDPPEQVCACLGFFTLSAGKRLS